MRHQVEGHAPPEGHIPYLNRTYQYRRGTSPEFFSSFLPFSTELALTWHS